MKAVLLFTAVLLCQSPGDVPKRVASPGSCYRAGPGVEVGPFPAGSVGCVSRASLERYAKFSKAGDRAGIEAMVKAGEAALIDGGTPLLVIAKHFTPARVEVMTPDQYDAQLRSGVGAGPAPLVDSLEVRAVEGPQANRVLFVEAQSVGLLTPDLVGRRVVLGRPGAAGNFPLLSEMPGVHRLRAAMSAGNLPVAVEMREQGQLVWVANDAPASVESTEGGVYRVRLLGGPRKGRVGWVDPAHVRFDSSIAVSSDPAAKGSGSDRTRAEHAATLLRAGRNLEKAGKRKAALENYRRVMAEFPGTPAAAEATTRAASAP